MPIPVLELARFLRAAFLFCLLLGASAATPIAAQEPQPIAQKKIDPTGWVGPRIQVAAMITRSPAKEGECDERGPDMLYVNNGNVPTRFVTDVDPRCGVNIEISAVDETGSRIDAIRLYANDILIYARTEQDFGGELPSVFTDVVQALENNVMRQDRAVRFTASVINEAGQEGRAGPLTIFFDSRASSMGENGKWSREGKDNGPFLLFPSSDALYLSFYLDNYDSDDVYVCYRKYDEHDPDANRDDKRQEDKGDGDECSTQTNDWKRVDFTVERKKIDSSERLESIGSDGLHNYWVGHYRAVLTDLEPNALYEYRIVQRDFWKTRRKFANRVVFKTPLPREGFIISKAPQPTRIDDEFRKEGIADASSDPGQAQLPLLADTAGPTPKIGDRIRKPPSKWGTPNANQEFYFTAIADLRSGSMAWVQKRIEGVLQDVVLDGMTDLVILPGDISNQWGTSYEYYMHYFRVYEFDTRFVPFYPIHGNHDLRGRDGYNFFSMFDLPPNPTAEAIEHNHPRGGKITGYPSFYSFDWDNTHFIGLDLPCIQDGKGDNISNTWQRLEEGTPQYKWLETDLAQSSGQRWRIVFAHCPIYFHLIDYLSPGLTDLLKKYRVDLFVGGHREIPFFLPDLMTDWSADYPEYCGKPLPVAVTPSGGSKGGQDPAEPLEHRFGFYVVKVSQNALYLTWLNQDGKRQAELKITKGTDGYPVTEVLKETDQLEQPVSYDPCISRAAPIRPRKD